MRRTKEQAAATRQTILKAADDLIVEHGFDKVSLDQIATAAGVKRGAIHFHFVNKPGVLVAILDDEHLPLQELVASLDDERSKPLLEGLSRVIVKTLRSFDGDRRKRALLRAMMTLGLRGESESSEIFVAFECKMDSLTFEVLDAVAKEGQLAAPWNARSAATAVHSCIAGLLLRWASSESDSSLLEGGVQMFRALIASFTVPKQGKKRAPAVKLAATSRR